MSKEIENKTKMSSPWVSMAHKIQAFFEKDPHVRVRYDDGERTVKLYVKGHNKEEALYSLIPDSISFGSESLKIEVVPDNESLSLADTFRIALESNPIFSRAFEIRLDGSSNAFTYVMFEPSVVQYWDDNLGDPHGIVSTLAQDLAKDIFMDRLGAMYSTDEIREYF